MEKYDSNDGDAGVRGGVRELALEEMILMVAHVVRYEVSVPWRSDLLSGLA